jgi:hypothetical protein
MTTHTEAHYRPHPTTEFTAEAAAALREADPAFGDQLAAQARRVHTQIINLTTTHRLGATGGVSSDRWVARHKDDYSTVADGHRLVVSAIVLGGLFSALPEDLPEGRADLHEAYSREVADQWAESFPAADPEALQVAADGLTALFTLAYPRMLAEAQVGDGLPPTLQAHVANYAELALDPAMTPARF